MSEIRNLTRNGETFYPLTHVEGVLDPDGNYIGNYVENPEFVAVWTDSEEKILFAIEKDGNVKFGSGVPKQVIKLLDEKVDKEENKKLISEDIANSLNYIENPEFIGAWVDRNDRILMGFRKNGDVLFGCGIPKQVMDYVEDKIEYHKPVPCALLNRCKELNIISDEELFAARPQFHMAVYKSFTPAIDYRGLLCFEGFSDYENFNTNAPILFEEHIITYNARYGYDQREYTYISKDFKNFTKYISNGQYTPASLNITWVTSAGANKDGLLLIAGRHGGEPEAGVYNGRGTAFMWSLDGGRTIEPATERIRAKLTISINDISVGTEVIVDEETLEAVSVADVQAHLKTYNNTQIEEKVQYARTYISDKILVGSSNQDKLRSLGYLLIERGYKVRLESDVLHVYYKEFGTVGNGKSITVGGVSKTFAGGENIRTEDIAPYITLEGDTGLKYNNGSDIHVSDLNQCTSVNYVDGKWYFTSTAPEGGAAVNGRQLAVVSIVIDDPSDLENTNVSYQKVTETTWGTDNCLVEPIMAYNDYYNLMTIGFRTQNANKQFYVYSKNKGYNWSDIQRLPETLDNWQDNAAVFVVRNPMKNPMQPGKGNEWFYNNINGYTNNMLLALSYSRRYGAIYACTASLENGIEKIKWSDWVVLNRYSKYLNNCGYMNLDMYYSDVSGYGSHGMFAYAPLHNCIALMYSGRIPLNNTFGGSNPLASWIPLITFEEC